MDINLTNQRTKVEAALPTFQAFQTEMDKRKAVWDRLDFDKKKRWIEISYGTKANPKTLAESKDPVMWLAVRMWQYFDDWEMNNVKRD